jgi:hypothetical protein
VSSEIERMQDLSRITNLHDVNRLLHDVVAKERACDAELVRTWEGKWRGASAAFQGPRGSSIVRLREPFTI